MSISEPQGSVVSNVKDKNLEKVCSLVRGRSRSSSRCRVLPGRRLTDNITRSVSALECDGKDDIIEPLRKRIKYEVTDSPTKMMPASTSSLSVRICSFFFSMLCFIAALMAVLLLIIFLLSFSFLWMQSRCEFLHHLKYDLEAIRHSYDDAIISQPLAINEIMSILSSFHSEAFEEPRVVWFVGWTGVGKSKSLRLLEHLVKVQSSVHYLIPTLLPTGDEAQEKFIAQTVSELNSCLRNIVIVDGWDEKEDERVISFVSGLLARVKEEAKEMPYLNQLLVIIAGTRGGNVLNREYLSLRTTGQKRSEITLQVLSEVLSQTQEYKNIETLGSATVVPYLPLEVEHVTECVRRELMSAVENNPYIITNEGKGFHEGAHESIVRGVLEHLPFVPSKNPLLSSTGCKKVFPLLKLVLGGV
ncbi:torsin-1A-like [Hyalella azteca]|uniref:Torsin-1A-like n=1 Tax=Hyalella azteca TaxID=294128 RepID=A0A979FMH3_HYAAZ|nr:torsin-1A-like [Hyalella azteca]